MKNILKLFILFLPFLSAAQYTENGCVVFLPFSGNLRDSTSNSLDASVNNGTITYGTDRFGNPNNAAVFDGHTVLTLGSSSKFRPASEYTTCIWVKVATFSTWNAAMTLRYNNQSAPYNSYGTGSGTGSYKKVQVTMSTANNPDQALLNGSLADYQWHHIAASYSSTSQLYKLYVDGVLVDTVATTGNVLYQSAPDLVLGGISTSFNGGAEWIGSLDDFRFYDKELSASRISQIAGKTTGINIANNNITSISIFPNPASQNIQVVTQNTLKNILIYDLQGNLVLQGNNSKQIFVGGLVKGLYLVKVTTEEGDLSKRIVIE